MKNWRRSARISPVTALFAVTAAAAGGEIADLDWNWPNGADPDEFRLSVTTDGINWQLQGPPFEPGAARAAAFDCAGLIGQVAWFEVIAKVGGVTVATAISNTILVT